MKIIYFTLLLLSITLLSFTIGDKKFPKADLKTLDGQTIHLNGSFEHHKLTVVSFWATWCSPCKKELDAIKELYPEWQKLGIELVAVTIDDSQALNKVKPMVAQKGWGYTILSDQNKDMLRLLNFQSVPQTFVVDATGTIVYTHNGYAPGDEYELEKKLKEFLK